MSSLMRNAYTAVLARGEWWEGAVQTEPYEAAWAGEALFFVRVMQIGEDAHLGAANAVARVQISPDGMHWCREGETLMLPDGVDLPAQDISFCRVAHFGSWLRLAGELPPDTSMRVIVYLTLKE